MTNTGLDSFFSRQQLTVEGQSYNYHSLKAAEQQLGNLSHLPYSLRLLLENLLRHEDGSQVTETQIRTLASWPNQDDTTQHVAITANHAVIHSASDLPILIDFAFMRDLAEHKELTVDSIAPKISVDLCIDNAANIAQLTFSHWCKQAFSNVSIENTQTGKPWLNPIKLSKDAEDNIHIYPNMLIGTQLDISNTAALGGLALQQGNLTTEAALLGKTLDIQLPAVIGVKLTDAIDAPTHSQQLCQQIQTYLVEQQLDNAWIEIYGAGLTSLSLDDRQHIAALASKMGIRTCLIPLDQHCLDQLTHIPSTEREAVKNYCQAQGFWHDPDAQMHYSAVLNISSQSFENELPATELDSNVAKAQTDNSSQTADASFSVPDSQTYPWQDNCCYVQPSALMADNTAAANTDIKDARILALFDDDICRSQIAPVAGIYASSTLYAPIAKDSADADNHAFSHPTLKNHLVANDISGGFSQHVEVSTHEPIKVVAQRYQSKRTPLIIFAGHNYGQNDACLIDHAARATKLMGVKAVISRSFDESHRSDLVKMGILPLQLIDGDCWRALELQGDEKIDITLPDEPYPFMPMVMAIERSNGRKLLVELDLRLDSDEEIHHYQHGGTITNLMHQMLEQE